jgi:hypothetical protein
MNGVPRIEVLLATYNGESFLREQIDSVLAQESVPVTILARDDGSSDGTQAILAEYAVNAPGQFRVLQDGDRTGTARGNFGRLLQNTDAPYVAFCDQDDVWLPHKLRASMQQMHALEAQHGTALPLLVFTDLRVVDQQLQTVSDSLWQTNELVGANAPTLSQLLSENVATGCTVLMNRSLADRMRSMPPAAQMHDHWAALLAASLGAMASVSEATVLYRQHTSNVIGAVQGRRSLSTKASVFLSSEGVQARRKQYAADRLQAKALLTLHGKEMTHEKRSVVEGFIALQTMPRLQRLFTTSRFSLWRKDKQRRLAQLIDLLRGE